MEPSSQDVTNWDELARAGHVHGGTLRVFGDFFGKPFDNFHLPAACGLGSSGELLVHFTGGELLSVWEPSDVRITASEFCIGDARRVLWEWYSYGRPPATENLRFIEHVTRGPVVRRTESDIRDRRVLRHRHLRGNTHPAVELVTYS